LAHVALPFDDINSVAVPEHERWKACPQDRLQHLRAASDFWVPGGASRALLQWVSKHHGAPQSLCVDGLRAVVADFDRFLLQPAVDDTAYVLAALRLRNVFARRAGLPLPVTVSLEQSDSPLKLESG